jgi:hypothetical protein
LKTRYDGWQSNKLRDFFLDPGVSDYCLEGYNDADIKTVLRPGALEEIDWTHKWVALTEHQEQAGKDWYTNKWCLSAVRLSLDEDITLDGNSISE